MQRRTFLANGGLGLLSSRTTLWRSGGGETEVPDRFPGQDPALVREVVAASHGRLDRVRELVAAYPELAKASHDWGYGDWESALGAASHTGRREIAELLIRHGARPTLFSAAMMGQLAIVKATIESDRMQLGIPGPHGIPLLAHARAGGERASAVAAYLEGLGASDAATPGSVSAEARESLLGTYRYGPAADEVLAVTDRSGALFIERPGFAARALTPVSPDLQFHPAGAPSVRISFEGAAGQPDVLRVRAGNLDLRARRAEAP